MKKLLTLAIAIVALAAFTGLSVAQEKKAGGKPAEPAAIPYADKVTLSATQKLASTTGCPVTARVGNLANPAWVYPGQTVNFVLVSPSPPPAPPSGVADAKSEVKRTVKHGQTVQATIQTPKGLVTSNNFACAKWYPAK